MIATSTRAAILAASILAVLSLELIPTGGTPATALPATDSDYATTPIDAPVPGWVGHCEQRDVPVTLPDHGAAHVTGQLCEPASAHPRTVLLLVHGATYDSSYFDWPLDPQRQSFVWAALRAGYATMSIDKLGAGQSSAPASQLVTFDVQADAIHRVVSALRIGDLGARFTHVVIVGHSFGSAEADAEIATYHDVDAVILTGSGHALSRATAQLSVSGFAPGATVAPNRFAGRDAGYITTTSAANRRALLYNNVTSPGVVNFDFRTEDVFSAYELTTRPANLGSLTRQITVPVELVNGSDDTHYCDGATLEFDLDDCSSAIGLYRSEAANYGPCFSASVVAGSGHDLTTEAGEPQAARDELAWVSITAPPTGAPVRCVTTGPFEVPLH